MKQITIKSLGLTVLATLAMVTVSVPSALAYEAIDLDADGRIVGFCVERSGRTTFTDITSCGKNHFYLRSYILSLVP